MKKTRCLGKRNMIKAKKFSKKQLIVMSWWYPSSSLSKHDAIICDGAIRSGKSFSMFLSFVMWSFGNFNKETFAICGKTITSLNRNMIVPMTNYLNKVGFVCEYKITKNQLIIRYKNRVNTYYVFGGKDEGSASLIQGITLAGVLFDEVVLMPQSFVEQALARCSVDRSKYWFNCNPQHPSHWFYRNWICKVKEKNALYVHFTMRDNPTLTPKIINRYKRIYSESFYKRFVEGKWSAPDGLVYSTFDRERHVISNLPERFDKYYVSCDYGTVNPTSMGLWGRSDNRGGNRRDNKWIRIKEYYYSSKVTGRLKTDEEYYEALLNLIGDREIEAVIIDPSAASFSQCIMSHNRFKVIPAKNDVQTGISKVTQALNMNLISFHDSCKNTFREFSLYQWNPVNDLPKKENDHAMDDIRYFVNTVINAKDEREYIGFSSISRPKSL